MIWKNKPNPLPTTDQIQMSCEYQLKYYLTQMQNQIIDRLPTIFCSTFKWARRSGLRALEPPCSER